MAEELSTKIQNLEIKLSYQEQHVATLNETVSLQQQDILELKNKIDTLFKVLQNIKQSSDSGIRHIAEETPPPHY